MPSKKKKATGNSETVSLTGDLTISRAAEILSLLKEAIQANERTVITLKDISQVDISCLQLFCSAHRTAAASGKTVILDAPVPKELRELINQTGFKRQKGCAFSPKTNCLCFDGGE